MKILQLGKFEKGYEGGVERVVDEVEKIQNDDLEICTLRTSRSLVIFGQPIDFKYLYNGIRLSLKSQIILVHHPNILAAVVALLGSFLTKSQILIFWHNDIIKQKFIYGVWRYFERVLLIRCDKIIVTSPQYAEVSVPLLGFLQKIEVIHLFSPLLKDSAINITAGKELEPRLDERNFVFVGRLAEYKGLYTLLEALRLNDCRLDVIGTGPLEKSLGEFCLEYEIQSRVRFHGRVSEDRKSSLIQNSCGLVLPSLTRNEGFGLVILEAFTLGIPVITTSVMGSGMSYANIHQITGLVVKPGDTVDLAKSMVELQSDRQRWIVYSNNALDRVNRVFSRENFRKGMHKLFSSTNK